MYLDDMNENKSYQILFVNFKIIGDETCFIVIRTHNKTKLNVYGFSILFIYLENLNRKIFSLYIFTMLWDSTMFSNKPFINL